MTPLVEKKRGKRRERRYWRHFHGHPLARIGPGLITGVADDDPSGIATYSQAGAGFGLNILWTMLVAFPLMSAVQYMCGLIGRVTGRGLAANMKAVFSPAIVRTVVVLLLIANTLNIAADVAAMGEVAELVTGIHRHILTIGVVFLTLGLQLFIPYHRYVRFLKWLTLSLLAYAAVLFTVHIPWMEVVRRTVWPHFRFDADGASVVVAVFGTTISPYLFFWQASEEVEEMQVPPVSQPLVENPKPAGRELRRIRWDTLTGMFFSDITAYFIILATALTLHTSGIRDIDTAAKAASALKPLAGNFAYLLFALGVLGVGLIGVPVLAGSAAYAAAETMGWQEGLERQAREAREFYGVITISVLAALVLQYSPMNPMKALFWSAVINGVVAVPMLVVLILLVSKKEVMGKFIASRPVLALAWITVAVMAAAAIRMFFPG
ncbi:MAG TPA: divalent metal cation transporter [Bryobacteraceae bacterium]|nr:divalent metal cation transporter [Bryobacteraceae bacterium]